MGSSGVGSDIWSSTGGTVSLISEGSVTLGTTDHWLGTVDVTAKGSVTQHQGSRLQALYLNVQAQGGDIVLANLDPYNSGRYANWLNSGSLSASTVDGVGGAVDVRSFNRLDLSSLSAGADKNVTLVADYGLTLTSGVSINTGTADLTLESRLGILATQAELKGRNITLSGASYYSYSDGLGGLITPPGVALNHDINATGSLTVTSGRGGVVVDAKLTSSGPISLQSAQDIGIGKGGSISSTATSGDALRKVHQRGWSGRTVSKPWRALAGMVQRPP
jgi:hypothetical protein